MLHRINYADGPYPMTHIIGDGNKDPRSARSRAILISHLFFIVDS